MFKNSDIHSRLAEMHVNPEVGRMQPCRIIGKTYFVGTYQASCHLIDTGDGLIMIDTGYLNTRDLVLDSIRHLGFSPKNIRYIVNTHWHGDHTAATSFFAELSGAKTLIGRDDLEKAKRYFTADIPVDDGDTLTLGNTTVSFMHTPGHTKGTLSFFYDTEDGGTTYRVGMFGGAGANTLVEGEYDFDGAREAYLASVDRLKREKVDVFIGNHTWNNNTYEKSLKLLSGGENEFIDGKVWLKFLEHCKARLERIISEES